MRGWDGRQGRMGGKGGWGGKGGIKCGKILDLWEDQVFEEWVWDFSEESSELRRKSCK